MFKRFFIWLALSAVMFSCKQYKRNKQFAAVGHADIVRGEKLAKQYCRSCHLMPDPKWLDANTWDKGVLPAMGPYLGIFTHNFQKYRSGRNDPFLGPDYYPSQPLVSPEDWQNIIDYFTATSPDSLPAAPRTNDIIPLLRDFEPISHALERSPPASSFIKIDTTGIQSRIIVADLFSRKIYWLDSSMTLVDSMRTSATIVDATKQENNATYLVDIGDINPNNKKLGSIGSLLTVPEKEGHFAFNKTIKDLARPVQLSIDDFNNDNRPDLLVCEFGFMKGSLSLFVSGEGDNYMKKEIRNVAGAVKTYVDDDNKDGHPDIWALFAQGNEGIFLFTNTGDGTFTEKQVLQFPSVYGSTFFEMVDFNNDGYKDILYTCGDNADYSPILKYYHGVYIFLNDGANNFKQAFFYPINGCYKALARDFDNDGDLDIAAISFFADYKNRPDEGFVYLSNGGDLQYSPFSIPEARRGRWITMDAGDLNRDGWTDIILGNFTYGPVIIAGENNWEKGGHFLLLYNRLKRRNVKQVLTH
jgi:hypothetical protein